MTASPVGIENVGYTITSAVRMHSEGGSKWTREDYWVVLGHKGDKLVSWCARQLPSGVWSFWHGFYENDAEHGFTVRVENELKKMVARSISRSKDGEEE